MLFEDLQGALTDKYFGVPGWVYVGGGAMVLAFIVMTPKRDGKRTTTGNLSEQDMAQVQRDYEKLMKGNDQLSKDFKPDTPSKADSDWTLDPVPIAHVGEPPQIPESALFTPYYNTKSNLTGAMFPSDVPAVDAFVEPFPLIYTGSEYQAAVSSYTGEVHKDPTKLPGLPSSSFEPRIEELDTGPEQQPSPPVNELGNNQHVPPIAQPLPNQPAITYQEVGIPEQSTSYEAPSSLPSFNGSATEPESFIGYNPPEPSPAPLYTMGSEAGTEVPSDTSFTQGEMENNLVPGPVATVIPGDVEATHEPVQEE